MKIPRKLTQVIAITLTLSLCLQQAGFAQAIAELNLASYFSKLSSPLLQEKFRPLHLRYLSYDNQANSFKLLLDKGDAFTSTSNNSTNSITQATQELLNYFFIGISLPNDSFWVNLRPDSPENIIDDYLAQTEVGKILLEADLQLKKDTAAATSPQTPEGKKYWDKLYKKAEELLGQDNLTIPTLVRPWIVPGEIIIRETSDNAYIYKATLKVCLEEDYLQSPQSTDHSPQSSVYQFKDPRLKALNEYSAQLIRELIIPKLTREVNTSKRYAALRQVYYSLILAQWFKARFYGKGGLYSWLIDKKNLSNLTSKDNWSKNTYFKQYQQSFKDGEYNLREPTQTPFGQSIRSYFSGGIAIDLQKFPAPGNTIINSSAGSPITSIAPANNRKLSYNGSHLLGIAVEGSNNPATALPAAIEIQEATSSTQPFTAASPVARPEAVNSPAGVTQKPTSSSPAVTLKEAEGLIFRTLNEQIISLFGRAIHGKFRVVNIGSTSRNTQIFEMGDREFDVDFMILFADEQNLRSFERGYTRTLTQLEQAFQATGLKIQHRGLSQNRAGDGKISYFILNGENEFKLEVNLSREKKIYADWFIEQMKQVRKLGGDPEFLAYEIRRMRRLMVQLGIYKLYEGGIGSIGIEQLTMQSGGSSEYGRKIGGVGSFHKTLDLIYNAGVDDRGDIISWGQAKRSFHIYDVETREDLAARFTEESWEALVRLAIQYRQRRPYSYDIYVENYSGKQQAEDWGPEEVQKYDINGYVQRMRTSGSGHFAVHLINSELIYDILKKGYLMPREFIDYFADIEQKASVLAAPSALLHFIVDGYLSRWKEAVNRIAFFAALEPLLENKAYSSLPKEKEEWAVTGFSDSAYDVTNRFYINELGIIFVPKSWESDSRFQAFLGGLPHRPRIYYYEGKTVQEGVNNFLRIYQISPHRLPRLSGYCEAIGTRGEGRTVYANIAPWSAVNRNSTILVDLPQTAEEFAETALRVATISKANKTAAYQFAQRAYALAPDSAKANLAMALLYYEPGTDIEQQISNRIRYFERALALDLPHNYTCEALRSLMNLYPQIGEFGREVEAMKKFAATVDLSQEQQINWQLGIARQEEKKTNLDAFMEKINRATSLDELSALLDNLKEMRQNYRIDYYPQQFAFRRLVNKFRELAQAEVQKLYQDSAAKIQQAKQGHLAKITSTPGPLLFDAGNLTKEIEAGFLKLEGRILEFAKKIEGAATLDYTREYAEERISQPLTAAIKDVRQKISAEIDESKKEISAEEDRARYRKELQDRIEGTRKDIDEAKRRLDAELNKGLLNAVSQYFWGIDSSIRFLLDDAYSSITPLVPRLRELGVNTGEFETQIKALVDTVESTIDDILNRANERGIGGRIVDSMRGQRLTLPENYKQRWIRSLPSPDRSSSPLEQPGAAASPVAKPGASSPVTDFTDSEKRLMKAMIFAMSGDFKKAADIMIDPRPFEEQGYLLDAQMAQSYLSYYEPAKDNNGPTKFRSTREQLIDFISHNSGPEKAAEFSSAMFSLRRKYNDIVGLAKTMPEIKETRSRVLFKGQSQTIDRYEGPIKLTLSPNCPGELTLWIYKLEDIPEEWPVNDGTLNRHAEYYVFKDGGPRGEMAGLWDSNLEKYRDKKVTLGRSHPGRFTGLESSYISRLHVEIYRKGNTIFITSNAPNGTLVEWVEVRQAPQYEPDSAQARDYASKRALLTQLRGIREIISRTQLKSSNGRRDLVLLNGQIVDQRLDEVQDILMNGLVSDESLAQLKTELAQIEEETKRILDYFKKYSVSDYWQRLGLNRNAGQEEIKKEYHRLMREFHPDRYENGLVRPPPHPISKTVAIEIAKWLGEAYASLSSSPIASAGSPVTEPGAASTEQAPRLALGANRSASSPAGREKESASSPINVFQGQHRKAADKTTKLEAGLNVCLAVAAFNVETGERAMVHFLPSGHFKGLATIDGDLEKHLEEMLRDISGPDWRIIIVSSKKEMEQIGGVFPYSILITVELIKGYLENRKSIDPRNILAPDTEDAQKTVTINDKGVVEILPEGGIRKVVALGAQEPASSPAEEEKMKLSPILYSVSADADWGTAFTDNSKPLKIEVGFGTGEELLKMTQANPEVNFIGVEIDSAMARLLIRRLEHLEKPIVNLKIMYSFDSDAFAGQKRENIVSEIYYIGIDAIPAHELAFTDSAGISSLQRLLKPGGKVYLAIIAKPGYADQIQRSFIKAGFRDITRDSRFPHPSDVYQSDITHSYVFQKPETEMVSDDSKFPKQDGIAASASSPAGREKESASSAVQAKSLSSASNKESLESLRNDPFLGEIFLEAIQFLENIGVTQGTHIIEVGTRNNPIRALAAASMGAHYEGYDLRFDNKKNIDRFNLEDFGGSATHILGEFSSGVKSSSKHVADHSQEVVLILTGALSDPAPESDEHEVLREALRVIMPGGKIVAGSIEVSDMDETIKREVLNEPEWKGKIELIKEGVVNRIETLSRGATIYTVRLLENSNWSNSEERKDDMAGSPAQNDAKGGIDFRGLPIVTQPVVPAMPGPSLRSGSNFKNIDLKESWQQIQNMLKAGIIPSSQRLKEYLQACCSKEIDIDSQIDKVLACIADILRLQEQDDKPTEQALKEVLVLLESGKPADQIPVALNNITVLPKGLALKP